MIGHLAQVYQVLPERHGVLIAFRDGAFTPDTERTFCRVLARRAHPKGGSSTELPEVGELGLVAELEGGFLVWVGGIHLLAEDENQIEPEEGARAHRDTAGIVRRSRPNGDAEWLHPSGLRFTVSEDAQALPALQRPGNPAQAPVPAVALNHPSGAKVMLSKDGDLTVTGPSGAVVSLTKDGAMSIHDCASVAFQGGAARFVMEAFVEWAKTHTHTGVMAGGASTGAPGAPPPAASLSPSTFKGPPDG